MNVPTRVFIAEQDAPTLLMLTLYLEQFEDIEIVGSAVARCDLEKQIRRLRPDVIIYNDCSSVEVLPDLICQLKSREESPALISIRKGNFLLLEGTFKQTPEALLSSFTSVESLLETIRRSAEKYRSQSATVVARDLTTPTFRSASLTPPVSPQVLPKAG